MQAALDSKNMMVVIVLATSYVILGSEAAEEWEKLSKEEELKLDRQLKLINKPAIKSFQTEYGDVIDCVDIYKQLAFDHPMLKNHTIQMKPTTIPKGIMRNEVETTNESLPYMPRNIRCPRGSVPIRRTNRKDLIMAKYKKSLGFNHPRNTHARASGVDVPGYHYAGLEYSSAVAGGKGRINVWNLTVKANQFSVASMVFSSGPIDQLNTIQAGWEVYQYLYPEGSRLYTYWTGDGYHKTGCFNTLCPGFVQVSSKIHLGLNLKPVSTYNGPQFEIAVSIHKDIGTGNWLLMFFDEYVGYWPKALFSSNMAAGADSVSWGGEVYSNITDLSPPMGSGHFAQEGFGKAAYVNQIQILLNGTSEYRDPARYYLTVYADKTCCYNAIQDLCKEGGRRVFFGGPGNCTFQM